MDQPEDPAKTDTPVDGSPAIDQAAVDMPVEGMAAESEAQASSSEPTPSKPSSGDDPLIVKLRQRIYDLNHKLTTREQLQLGFVYENYPLSYYKSWKGEANEVLILLVNLRKRLQAREKKLALTATNRPTDQNRE